LLLLIIVIFRCFFSATNISKVEKYTDLRLATYIAHHSATKAVDHLGGVLKGVGKGSTHSRKTAPSSHKMHQTDRKRNIPVNFGNDSRRPQRKTVFNRSR